MVSPQEQNSFKCMKGRLAITNLVTKYKNQAIEGKAWNCSQEWQCNIMWISVLATQEKIEKLTQRKLLDIPQAICCILNLKSVLRISVTV